MTTTNATVLFTNEPRAYRETLALAVAATHPHLDALAFEPADLEREMATRHPVLVVSSEPGALASVGAPSWVLLYRDGARMVVVRIDGEESVRSDLDLDGLLALVDQVVPAPVPPPSPPFSLGKSPSFV
ncbi:MAG: hypothetical protein AVDCRST_MAG70-358 [uncultured Thermomicrobiales bacterium]|uniref:Uncharacterized protein n=1 Tax=uncultured Thermomicrobiales bacterium TaxID=1645740 RepID=A0A6J4U9J8_9BACT|nr:MAG: hypothetical protein AVDCRST_MAG70-358 [uncultured Thermomicrobiales bacterium]